MSLKASEQIALDAIEHNLRIADPELTIAFESFTTVTANTALPESERLGGPRTPTVTPADHGPEPAKMTFAMWLTVFFLVGMVLAGTALALFSGASRSGCPGPARPAFAQARTAGGLPPGRTGPSCSGFTQK